MEQLGTIDGRGGGTPGWLPRQTGRRRGRGGRLPGGYDNNPSSGSGAAGVAETSRIYQIELKSSPMYRDVLEEGSVGPGPHGLGQPQMNPPATARHPHGVDPVSERDVTIRDEHDRGNGDYGDGGG